MPQIGDKIITLEVRLTDLAKKYLDSIVLQAQLCSSRYIDTHASPGDGHVSACRGYTRVRGTHAVTQGGVYQLAFVASQ